MTRGYTGGKRQREADRDRKKKDKEERLRRNRALRAQGIDPDAPEGGDGTLPAQLPEVALEDVVIGVAPRPKTGGFVGTGRLFVGRLSWDTSTEDLRAAFAKFGNVTDATVITDRATGRSRGFGFVTFENPIEAAEAAKALNGTELDGRMITVNHAERR
jgi:hypothetical protein